MESINIRAGLKKASIDDVFWNNVPYENKLFFIRYKNQADFAGFYMFKKDLDTEYMRSEIVNLYKAVLLGYVYKLVPSASAEILVKLKLRLVEPHELLIHRVVKLNTVYYERIDKTMRGPLITHAQLNPASLAIKIDKQLIYKPVHEQKIIILQENTLKNQPI